MCLHDHIRHLEAIVHDREIEQMIERGHIFRSGRRFVRALKSYRSALRAMASDDPRRIRLEELMANTRRLKRQVSFIYIIVVLLLACFAVMIYLPRYRAAEFERRTETVINDLQGLQLEQLQSRFQEINQSYQSLLVEARERGELVEDSRRVLVTSFESAQIRLASQLLNRAQDHIGQGDIEAASQTMVVYRTYFKEITALAQQSDRLGAMVIDMTDRELAPERSYRKCASSYGVSICLDSTP